MPAIFGICLALFVTGGILAWPALVLFLLFLMIFASGFAWFATISAPSNNPWE